MSSLAITNISSTPLWLRDIYTALAPGETKIVDRTPAEMGDMRGLQDYIAQGKVEVSIVLPANEINSELVSVWPLGLNWRPTAPTLPALNALPVLKNKLGDIRVVTGTLTPYMWDGAGWVSLSNYIGTPGQHASTHATGGSDAVTVTSTTATNQSATTGISVNAATATNNGLLLTGWYALNSVEADGLSQGSLAQNVASNTPSAQPGVPRTMDVTFPAGWAGGTLTINGTGRGGAAISETFTKPGGGGTVVGTKAFFTVTNYVNSAPTVAGFTATVGLGDAYGVPHDNVVAFLKVSIDGSADTFDIADTVNGTFDPVGAHHGNHNVDVWYTYTLTISQASHTHTVTDAGHTHTQTSHTHNLS